MSAFNVQCFSIFPLSNLSVCDGEHKRDQLSISRQYWPICQSTCQLKIGLLSIAILVDMSIDTSADT